MSKWKRPLCWVLGHKWLWLRMNKLKHLGLVHLHVNAGLDLDCERCGYEWRDADHWVSHEIVEIPATHRKRLQLNMRQLLQAILRDLPEGK